MNFTSLLNYLFSWFYEDNEYVNTNDIANNSNANNNNNANAFNHANRIPFFFNSNKFIIISFFTLFCSACFVLFEKQNITFLYQYLKLVQNTDPALSYPILNHTYTFQNLFPVIKEHFINVTNMNSIPVLHSQPIPSTLLNVLATPLQKTIGNILSLQQVIYFNEFQTVFGNAFAAQIHN
jgi:hypothetical protein